MEKSFAKRRTKGNPFAEVALGVYEFIERMMGISPAAIAPMSLFFSRKLLLYMTYPMIIKAKTIHDSTEGLFFEAVKKIRQYPYTGMSIL